MECVDENGGSETQDRALSDRLESACGRIFEITAFFFLLLLLLLPPPPPPPPPPPASLPFPPPSVKTDQHTQKKKSPPMKTTGLKSNPVKTKHPSTLEVPIYSFQEQTFFLHSYSSSISFNVRRRFFYRIRSMGKKFNLKTTKQR